MATEKEEQDARQAARDLAQANFEILAGQATQALQNNRDFQAIVTPTNAQIVAQVRALTRQSNALIRLELGYLEGTD